MYICKRCADFSVEKLSYRWSQSELLGVYFDHIFAKKLVCTLDAFHTFRHSGMKKKSPHCRYIAYALSALNVAGSLASIAGLAIVLAA